MGEGSRKSPVVLEGRARIHRAGSPLCHLLAVTLEIQPFQSHFSHLPSGEDHSSCLAVALNEAHAIAVSEQAGSMQAGYFITMVAFATLYLFPRKRGPIVFLYAFLECHYSILCFSKERKPPLREELFLMWESIRSLQKVSQNPFNSLS